MLTPHDYDVPPVFSPDLTAGTGLTQSIRIAGRVFDADGAAVVDAMIEIWQADAKGDYATSEAVLEGNRRPCCENAGSSQEITDPRQKNRRPRFERAGVDHRRDGVGGVVKSIHKLKAQCDY